MHKHPVCLSSLLRDPKFWKCVSDISLVDISRILGVSYSTLYRARAKLGYTNSLTTICQNPNPTLTASEVMILRRDMIRNGSPFVREVMKKVIRRAYFHKRFFPTMAMKQYILQKIYFCPMIQVILDKIEPPITPQEETMPETSNPTNDQEEEEKEETLLNILFPDARTDPSDTTDYSWMQNL